MSTTPKEFPLDEIHIKTDMNALTVTMHTDHWSKIKLHIDALEQKLAVAENALEKIVLADSCGNCQECAPCGGGMEYPQRVAREALVALALINPTPKKGDGP